MRKKNRGFTLIELMIAVAVLSTMAAVLFQTFVVSRRMDAKARREEVLQDLSQRTMEEMKGFSFGALDRQGTGQTSGEGPSGGGTSGGGTGGKITIAGEEYQYKPLESGEDTGENGYLLIREYKSNPTEEKAEYLICVEADRGHYSLTSDGSDGTGGSGGSGGSGGTGGTGGTEDSGGSGTVYSVNQYQMPNIADVSSFQNVVLDPQTVAKDDGVNIAELLLKVNPDEEDETGGGENAAAEDSGEDETSEKPQYGEGDVTRYLQVDIKEQEGASGNDEDDGRLTVKADAIYTVEGSEPSQKTTVNPSDLDSLDAGLKLKFPLLSSKKRVAPDPRTGKPVNRIYLFLPDSGGAGTGGGTGSDHYFSKIYVTADLQNPYELYVIVPSGGGLSRDTYISMTVNGNRAIYGAAEKAGTAGVGELELYTNLANDKPVSLYAARDRLYRLTVTIYEADYGTAGEAGTPAPGKELIRLESTKSE